jgi:hypothetical protein
MSNTERLDGLTKGNFALARYTSSGETQLIGTGRLQRRGLHAVRRSTSFSAKRDSATAQRFLTKALGGENRPEPRVINSDKHAAYPSLPCFKPRAIWPTTVNTAPCNISKTVLSLAPACSDP